jgi:molybdopterin molybdotransferase
VETQAIEIEEARQLVLEHVAPLGGEHVPLRAGLGRVLAEAVESPGDVPAFDGSAMDGFAVRAADTEGAARDAPVRLRTVDESRAGRPATQVVKPGLAIAISTGAAMPDGADAVVRVEDTMSTDDSVEVLAEVAAGRDVRYAGEDIRAGAVVCPSGTRLGPAELGVLASVGRSSLNCYRRPRVRVLTTGDELLDPDDALRPAGVRNSNAYSIPALALRAGAEVVGLGSAPDQPAATRTAISEALASDVAVICGGVSVGAHDHVKRALAELGVQERFWRVALRPGGPTWFGGHAGGVVFGLPGNPVSAMVTFILFVNPALLVLGGGRPQRRRTTAVLDRAYEKTPGRAHAIRCRIELREDGWHVDPFERQGSHVLTSMLGAGALAIIPAASARVPAGSRVAIELLPNGSIEP